MQKPALDSSFSDQIATELPALRRYARSLTGSQLKGDQHTIATLEAILKDRSGFENENPLKINLFKCFHQIWLLTKQDFDNNAHHLQTRAHQLLAKLTSNSREAMLLRTLEDFSFKHIAEIMQTDPMKIRQLVSIAFDELAESVKGRVMIIEDEPIIAADLSAIVESLGHEIDGIARTQADAIKLGKSGNFDLILADIQLADNSSGIDAVNDLLKHLDRPVIFITAFPERLLTGDRPEPAFLISKPFREAQVQSAVSQAMFFASTATLTANETPPDMDRDRA